MKRAKRKEDNRRQYDKKHACYYCGKLDGKIARHYLTHHKNEEDVARALGLEVKSPERKAILEKLRCLGDFHHNKNVEASGEGEVIVVRRPGQRDNGEAEQFVPCVYCFG